MKINIIILDVISIGLNIWFIFWMLRTKKICLEEQKLLKHGENAVVEKIDLAEEALKEKLYPKSERIADVVYYIKEYLKDYRNSCRYVACEEFFGRAVYEITINEKNNFKQNLDFYKSKYKELTGSDWVEPIESGYVSELEKKIGTK